ncbi:MAG: RIP metalloprotease RseP [Anaerolineaceae bacterium]|nr:RIP metalloprotease RseP [Anaerolineaceae bacterium]
MLDFLLGNDFLSAVIAFILVLIPAILIHEIGHFLAAKSIGVAVLEFGIGIPPRMIRLFKRGETEYTLNWLPLGGFVLPLGEDFVRPVDAETVERDRSRAEVADEISRRKLKALPEAGPLQRIFFMGAGAAMNFLMAFVLFALVALIGIPQPVGGSVELVSVEPDSALAAAGVQSGDFVVELNGAYFANSQDFFQALYARNGQPVTLLLQRPGMEAPLEIHYTPQFGTTDPTTLTYVRVAGVVEDSPAGRAGILPGDLILAINGEAFANTDELKARTTASAGQSMSLTIQRGDETLDVSLVPREIFPEGQGAMGIGIWSAYGDPEAGVVYQEGVEQQVMVSQSLGESLRYGVERIGFIVSSIARIPSQIINHEITPEEARPIGIVAISQVGASALRQSVEQNQPILILNYIAMINVALGLTNLLPLPALDGGRIVFVLLEIVRGRPISPEREGLVHLVGFALLLSLFFVITINDLANPITNLLP